MWLYHIKYQQNKKYFEKDKKGKKFRTHEYFCKSLQMLKLASPCGSHMSGEVSSVVEQLIVFEEFVCRVVRLHALRTDEALETETRHHTLKTSHQGRSERFRSSIMLGKRYLGRLVVVQVSGGFLRFRILGASLPRSLQTTTHTLTRVN